MKKIILIAAILSAVGCSDLDMALDTNGGKGLEFVHFTAPSVTEMVTEDTDTHTYTVTVGITSSSDTARNFPVTLGEGTTGIEGTDFNISKKSIEIPAGEYTGAIDIDLLYDNLDADGFVLELVLEADKALINPTYGNTCTLTFKTDKVIIDWDWLVGSWNASDDGSDPYGVSFAKVDETHLTLYNFWDGEETITGTVDFENRTITFDPHQIIYQYPGYGPVYVNHYDIDSDDYDTEAPIMAYMSALGIEIEPYQVILESTPDSPFAGAPYDFGVGTTMIYR